MSALLKLHIERRQFLQSLCRSKAFKAEICWNHNKFKEVVEIAFSYTFKSASVSLDGNSIKTNNSKEAWIMLHMYYTSQSNAN
jgi:hypothetical protein